MASSFGESGLSVLRRTLAFGVLWLALTGGASPGSWWIGAPAVVGAALVSVRLVPRSHIRYTSALRFLPVFLLRSLVAAFDVARRTFQIHPPIAPRLLEHDTALPSGLSRVVFMSTVSLLPGTLSAALDGDRVSIHVLDYRQDHAGELSRLEKTIARIFPQAPRD